MKIPTSIRNNNRLSWLVLGIGLMLVAAATLYLKTTMDREVKLDFDVQCGEIKNKIIERLYAHARILRSGAAFFNASDNVTRDEWRVFAKRDKIEQRLLGIQGLGFSLLVLPAELARHIQEIRSEGFPEYTVTPAGDRKIYTPVIYLEPFDERNQRAFGYDTFLEPVRRAAMERARDEDLAILSGKVTLLQETDEDVQAGTLMYVPVYRKGMPIDSVEQRRAAIFGWVSSVYRMTDLFQGILGDYNLERDQYLHLQVYDGAQPLPQNLLYQCHSLANSNRRSKEQFNQLIPIDFNGHRWTLHLVKIDGGLFAAHYMGVWFALCGGMLITLLLFVLIRTLQGRRSESQRMAQELTVDLRAERQRLASIIQGTNVGTWEWNVQTGDVVFNDMWAKMLGYTLDELAPIGIKIWETLTHPEDLKKSGDVLAQHFSGARTFYECECRMKHKDGRWIWVLDRGQLVSRTSDGRPLMMYGTHTEISERKQAEEQITQLLEESNQARNALLGIIEDEERSKAALRESESALREAQVIAHLGGYVLNIPSGRWKSSDVLDEVLGIDATYDHSIEGWTALIHSADRAMMGTYLKDEIISGGKPFNKEYRIIRQNDQVECWVQGLGRLEFDEHGLPVKMVGTIQDITERRRADDRIKESEAQLRSILDNAPFQIWAFDGEQYSFVNKAYYDYTGLDKTKVLTAEVWTDFVHPDDLATAGNVWMDAWQRKAEHENFFRLRNRDGQYRDFWSHATPVFDDNGSFKHFQGFNIDITERKLAEKERLKLEAQLQHSRKMEVVGQLAGGVAHDFNNILQSIMGYAQLAAGETDLSASIQDDLTEIQKAARRAADLTRQLLIFARKQDSNPRMIDLNQSLGNMLKMLRPLIGENIELVCELGTDLWPVKMDPIQVDQILANLCVNARDSIDGIGGIHIVTENRLVDEGQSGSNDGVPPGDYVVLVVSDTGCGMDEETQERIFEPFFTTKEIGKGTGLGLATVYGIVQQNDGHIGIHSEVGKGTTFRIYLPRFTGDITHSDDASAVRKPDTGRGTVLLVEDEPSVLSMGTRMLRTLGYTVLPASSPEVALQLAEEHATEIQLLLTDVIMPGMNGRELARILKARLPHIKQLFMSGYTANVMERHDGDPAQVGLLLSKPFSMESLAGKIKEVLEN